MDELKLVLAVAGFALGKGFLVCALSVLFTEKSAVKTKSVNVDFTYYFEFLL